MNVTFNTIDNNRFPRSDNSYISLFFHTLNHLQLFVVYSTTPAQCFTYLRIFTINKRGNADVFIFFPITAVPGKDNHIVPISIVYGTLQRNRVDNTSVQHGNTVYISYGANERKAAGSTDNVDHTVFILFLLKIIGFSGQAIGSHHHITLGRIEVCLIIVWKYMLGKLRKKEIEVQNIPFLKQMFQPDIMIFL